MRVARHRKLLVPIVAAALAFGATVLPATTATADEHDEPTPINVQSEKGVLRLHVDHPKRANGHFRFDAKNSGGGYTVGSEQSFSANNTCAINLASTPALGGLTGVQSPGADPSAAVVGVSKGGIGVIDPSGSTGVLCGRVDSTQELRLKLGGFFASGDAIDYAELDIEGKQNVTVVASAYRGGELVDINPSETETTVELSDTDFGGNDNGSDNGSNDNARLVIGSLGSTSNPLFDEIRLSAESTGSFSLEGGADGTPFEPGGLGASLSDERNDSVFRVVQRTEYDDGLCGDPVGPTDGEGTSTVTLHRTDVDVEDCANPIPYSLIVRGDDEVQLLKDEATVRNADATFILTITWGEAASYPDGGSEFDLDGNDATTNDQFVPDLCANDEVGNHPYPNNPSAADKYWPEDKTLADGPEQPWCVFDVHVSSETGAVTETFYGAGDPLIKRSF